MTEKYYNQLTPYYKYIYLDWEASILRQASQLDAVIRENIGEDVRSILDAACGIGTQSIGLAQLGYQITASDISKAEIEHARQEATQRGLSLDFMVADMRELGERMNKQFDVVLACDNAIPHLLSESDILLAFKQFCRCTAPAGGCLISVRDYAHMERGGTKFYPRTVNKMDDGRLVIFDLWQFDGDFYDITTYVVEDRGLSQVKTTVIRGGRYFCVTIDTLEKLLRQAGFPRVKTIRDRYFQPLIVGVKG